MPFSTNKEGRVKGVDCFGPCKRWNLEPENFTTAKGLIAKFCRQCSDARFQKMRDGNARKFAARSEHNLKQAFHISGIEKCTTDLERLICVAKAIGVQEERTTFKGGWMKNKSKALLDKLSIELDQLVLVIKNGIKE